VEKRADGGKIRSLFKECARKRARNGGRKMARTMLSKEMKLGIPANIFLIE
jgi:hypothetical protein